MVVEGCSCNQDMVVSESKFDGQLCFLVKNATSECFVARRVYAWWGQHAWSFSKMLMNHGTLCQVWQTG